MQLLNPINFGGAVFNVADMEKFQLAMKYLRESLFDKGASLYAADNLITWNRNLSFLREDFFIEHVKNDNNTFIEKSTVWRLYVLLYFAEVTSKIEGDFVELGCHKGITALNVVKKIDFAKLGKKYYLYDIFEWNEGDEHTHMPGHDNKNMYEDVVKMFEPYPFAQVIKGSVPESLSQAFPEDKIAFAHIDMNHPAPESGALKQVLPKLSKGGIIVFDDYGWWGYSAQKMAIDPVVAEYGQKILELPTGQAILINN